MNLHTRDLPLSGIFSHFFTSDFSHVFSHPTFLTSSHIWLKDIQATKQAAMQTGSQTDKQTQRPMNIETNTHGDIQAYKQQTNQKPIKTTNPKKKQKRHSSQLFLFFLLSLLSWLLLLLLLLRLLWFCCCSCSCNCPCPCCFGAVLAGCLFVFLFVGWLARPVTKPPVTNGFLLLLWLWLFLLLYGRNCKQAMKQTTNKPTNQQTSGDAGTKQTNKHAKKQRNKTRLHKQQLDASSQEWQIHNASWNSCALPKAKLHTFSYLPHPSTTHIFHMFSHLHTFSYLRAPLTIQPFTSDLQAPGNLASFHLFPPPHTFTLFHICHLSTPQIYPFGNICNISHNLKS